MKKLERIYLCTTEEWATINVSDKTLIVHPSISEDKIAVYNGGLAPFDGEGNRLTITDEKESQQGTWVTLRDSAHRYEPVSFRLEDLQNDNYELKLVASHRPGAKFNEPVVTHTESLFKITRKQVSP